MPRRNNHAPLVIHRYQQRPCLMTHQTWSGDYAQVKTFTARELLIFINSHTPEYLTLFCEHTPALETFLETSEHRGSALRILHALSRHFQQEHWEGDEP